MKIILALIFLVPTLCLADTYQGIGYSATLGEVKARFPNATFQNVKPAWATESDAVYDITGKGISGKIIVKFDDSRPFHRQIVARGEMDVLSSREQAALSDDDALTVAWVRWVPDTPIPLARLVSKYGKPTMAGFADDDMSPYRHWSLRGINATLSDDEKKVLNIVYVFNKADCLAHYRPKYKDEKFSNALCQAYADFTGKKE